MIKIILIVMGALLTQVAQAAGCKSESFSIAMEFPDGSFVARSSAMPQETVEMVNRFIKAGISPELAQQRVGSFQKALSLFQSDPGIRRTTLTQESGGDGRVYELHHWCNDGINKRTVTPPRVIGFPIREESSMTVWAKNWH